LRRSPSRTAGAASATARFASDADTGADEKRAEKGEEEKEEKREGRKEEKYCTKDARGVEKDRNYIYKEEYM
jgi:hypothetical protein